MQSPINYFLVFLIKSVTTLPEKTATTRLHCYAKRCGQVKRGPPISRKTPADVRAGSLFGQWLAARHGWRDALCRVLLCEVKRFRYEARVRIVFAISSILILISAVASGADLVAAGHSGGARSEADEKTVWDLWRAHLSSSNNHEAVLAAFQQGQKNAPSNSLFVVAQGLCSWHLLKKAKTNEAVELLAAMISAKPADPLGSAGSEMGRRWLTRIDREKVRSALGCYYRQQIAYPPNLEPLKKMPVNSAPLLTDRWDAPWIYQLTGFKTIKGLANQRYLLQSAQLKESSDLKTALAQPYAGTIKIKPVSVAVTASGAPSVKFESADQKNAVIVLSEGTKLDTISLVYVGNRIIILSDGDYWLIAPKPRQ